MRLAPLLSLRLFFAALVALPLLFVITPVQAQSGPPQQVLYPGLDGQALLDAIRSDYTPTQTLGYGPARDSLYAYEDRTDGALCGVYTQFCVFLDPTADPSTDAYYKGINAEHTWPQSMGAAGEPSKSDLHHLFPAKDNVNSSRSNHPYGEIPDAETDGWYREQFSQSTVPTVVLDAWSEKDNDHPDPAYTGRFEPREDHAGDAARATFYFRAIYDAQVTAYGSEDFFDVQKDDLVRWHYQDTVSWEEYDRAAWIAAKQGTNNPFVLDSTLARRAFGLPAGGLGDPGGDPPPTGGSVVWINELHYDNDAADAAEGVEVAGTAGTDLAGYELVFYNGNGSTVYKTTFLSGTLSNQQGGYGTAWFPVGGVQNGSPDGIALVAPDATLLQFISYEGTLTALDGPAAGHASEDIGVAETSSTPAGHSLQLGGQGMGYADFAWETPQTASPGQPNPNQTLTGGTAAPLAWINELHYDNTGADRDEGIEIAGTAGLDLAGWSLILYNGAGGAPYDTHALSGVIDDESTGYGAVWFAVTGVQNGSPDGVALVDDTGTLVQFLSYEGDLTGTSGVASGTASDDIGVAESSGTAENYALQLTGTGAVYGDFAWSGPAPHSRGSLNAGQSVGGGARPVTTTGDKEQPASPMLALGVYPNPLRGRGTVYFELTERSEVTVSVYDLLGRRVVVLADGLYEAGWHRAALDASELGSGSYIVRAQFVRSDGRVQVSAQKMTLVR